jgi:hypothetical protein
VGKNESGVYYSEIGKMKNAAFGRDLYTRGKLVKTDLRFNILFTKDYTDQLKGLSFESIWMSDDELYIFGKEYFKNGTFFKYYAAKIDKKTGELIGGLAEVGQANSVDFMSVGEEDWKGMPGMGFLHITHFPEDKKITMDCFFFDEQFKNKESFKIELPFDPKYFILQDLIYTNNKEVVLLGKEYEDDPDGKKKKSLRKKGYSVWVYNIKLNKIRNIPFSSDKKNLIQTNLFYSSRGQSYISGFFCNSSGDLCVNGFCIYKVDPENGKISLVSESAVNVELLEHSFLYDKSGNALSKSEKRDLKEIEGVIELKDNPARFFIKSCQENPGDGSFVNIAELSKYSYNTQSPESGPSKVINYYVMEDLIIINSDSSGHIKWIKTVPKSQYEKTKNILGLSVAYSGLPYDAPSYFQERINAVNYSSFRSIIRGNKLFIILNDHANNHENTVPGQDVQTVYDFAEKSNLYCISVDLATGTMTRQNVYTNDKKTIISPLFSWLQDDGFLIPIPESPQFQIPDFIPSQKAGFRIAMFSIK